MKKAKPVQATRSGSSLPVILILFVLFALTLGTSLYFYNEWKKTKNLLANPTAASQEQVSTLVEKVGKHILLPKEEPQVEAVVDVSKLKDQPFFKNAKNGDRVLIYIKAKKAILYRPSTDQIIEVAPLNIGTPVTPSPTKTPTETPTPTEK